MLDTRQVRAACLKLDLTLPPAARGVYSLSVEASADLQHWHGVQSAVQVLSLEHQGQRLASTGIDLDGVRPGLPAPDGARPQPAARAAVGRGDECQHQIVPQPDAVERQRSRRQPAARSIATTRCRATCRSNSCGFS
jgi:hypothetical protein